MMDLSKIAHRIEEIAHRIKEIAHRDRFSTTFTKTLADIITSEGYKLWLDQDVEGYEGIDQVYLKRTQIKYLRFTIKRNKNDHSLPVEDVILSLVIGSKNFTDIQEFPYEDLFLAVMYLVKSYTMYYTDLKPEPIYSGVKSEPSCK